MSTRTLALRAQGLAIALAILLSILGAPQANAEVVGPARAAGAPSAPAALSATIALDVPPSIAVSPMAGPKELGLYSLRAMWVSSMADADAPVTGYTVIVARPKGAPMSQPVPLSACSAGGVLRQCPVCVDRR